MASKYLTTDDSGTTRCWWCGQDPMYMQYHDEEWGRPVVDDVRLFEKICLEGFQSGLSWLTILRKRENFRAAFDDFRFETIARYKTRQINRLLKDAGIVRHRGKIESTINNAKQAVAMAENHGSLAHFFWQYEPSRKRKFDAKRSITDESTKIIKDLKRLGWSFIGPTTCYAFMQAMGMVNDHHPDCFAYRKVETEREKFKRPASA